MIGKNDFELFPQAVAQRLVEEDREVFASGGSLGFEQELPGPGGPNQVHTIKTVCRDRAGQIIGLVGISRDMRERRQLLDALRERERDLTEAIASPASELGAGACHRHRHLVLRDLPHLWCR